MTKDKKPFLKLMRGKEAEELMKKPDAFLLLTQIALRARRSNELSVENLKMGEAKIGDYKEIGLTERRYRTAKKNIQSWGLATFKATNRGTIAKLENTKIYDINEDKNDEPNNGQKTSRRRSSNSSKDEQETTNNKITNKEGKNGKNEKKINNNVGFEEFWNLYDYKKAKPKALQAYEKALRVTTHEEIVKGVEAYKKSRGLDKQYWKHPTTWLNTQAWGDEYATKKKSAHDLSDKKYGPLEGFDCD